MQTGVSEKDWTMITNDEGKENRCFAFCVAQLSYYKATGVAFYKMGVVWV